MQGLWIYKCKEEWYTPYGSGIEETRDSMQGMP